MSDGPITDILKQVRFLSPEDPVEKAVGVLRAAQSRALPVTRHGRVVGLVSEQDLIAHASAGSSDAASTDGRGSLDPDSPPGPENPAIGKSVSVGDVMTVEPACANIYMPISQAAEVMRTTGADVLPVVDEFGSYRGVVTRSDVLAALFNVLRPPMVAGMATPLGVHLTTGAVSAGAGNLGLFLAGVSLMMMMEAARFVIWLALFATDKLAHTHLVPLLWIVPSGPMSGWAALGYVLIPLQLVLMMAFLRLSPMSGYHAAEHQVVHTIEAGEPLTPEAVSRMPRAHPRCGTNLMAAATLFTAIVTQLGSATGVVIAMLVVVFFWRTVGYYLQQFVTTKKPSERQLMNGIKVGEQLIAKYREHPNKVADPVSRIWSTGMPQVALGFITVLSLDNIITSLLHLPPWL